MKQDIRVKKLLSDFASGRLMEMPEDRKRKNGLLRKALEDFRNHEELKKEGRGYEVIKKKRKK